MNKLLDTTDAMTLAVGVRFTMHSAGGDGAAEAPESTASDADFWVTQTATRMNEGHWAWDGQQLEIPPMAMSAKLRVLLVPKDSATAGTGGAGGGGGAASPTPSDRSGGKRTSRRALGGSSSSQSINPNQPRELATAELSLLPPPVGDTQRIEIKASAGSGLAYAPVAKRSGVSPKGQAQTQAGPPAGVLVVDIVEAPVHEEGDTARSDFDEHLDEQGSTMESLDSLVDEEKSASVMSGNANAARHVTRRPTTDPHRPTPTRTDPHRPAPTRTDPHRPAPTRTDPDKTLTPHVTYNTRQEPLAGSRQRAARAQAGTTSQVVQ